MITLFGKRYRLFRPRSIWIRKIVQAFFFVLIALISVNHALAESGKGIPLLASASLHALCPFGGVVTIYQFATTGTFVQKIYESAFNLNDTRFSPGHPLWSGFLRLGLSARNHPGMGQQVREKALQTEVQSLHPRETGPSAALHPLSGFSLGDLYDRCHGHVGFCQDRPLFCAF